MIVGITADIHIGVQGKLSDTMWALRKIRQHCVENNAKHLIILGDLLHDREHICIEDWNLLVEFLIETDEKFGITVIAFPGNHDMYLKNSWDINGVKPLSRYLTSYSDLSKFELDGTRFWVLPFIHYESHYMDVLKKVEGHHKDGDVLLTHVGVKSSLLNVCFLLKSWSIVDFTNSPFDRVYAGHFHVHQQVGKNVWYPGSPIPFRFDEGDTPHGFMLFDTATREHTFIDLWECNDEYKPPQYCTIDDKSISDMDSNVVGNNIIRVALSQEYTHNQLDEIKDSLQKLGAREVRWLNLISKEEADVVSTVKGIASADDLFKKFVEADKDGASNLSVNLLMRLNAEIMADGDRKHTTEGYIPDE